MEQANVAAGTGTVMVLDHIPTDMHCNGRAARMLGPAMILGVENATTKAHIGHFVKQIMRD
eukprot:13790213-Ditylum_brightwellii.AAC.1